MIAWGPSATLHCMNSRSPMPSAAFDPFGEPMDSVRPCAGESRRHGGRLAAVVVFWTLALALLAGRVYLGDQTSGQTAFVAEPTLTVAQAAPLR